MTSITRLLFSFYRDFDSIRLLHVLLFDNDYYIVVFFFSRFLPLFFTHSLTRFSLSFVNQKRKERDEDALFLNVHLVDPKTNPSRIERERERERERRERARTGSTTRYHTHTHKHTRTHIYFRETGERDDGDIQRRRNERRS